MPLGSVKNINFQSPEFGGKKCLLQSIAVPSPRDGQGNIDRMAQLAHRGKTLLTSILLSWEEAKHNPWLSFAAELGIVVCLLQNSSSVIQEQTQLLIVVSWEQNKP